MAEGEVLHGDFVLRDGTHTDTYVIRPTLTDEELAEWLEEVEWEEFEHGTPGVRGDKLLRLIAALRASRAEVERLRSEAREEYARAQQAETALVAAKAEVERLRTDLNELTDRCRHKLGYIP